MVQATWDDKTWQFKEFRNAKFKARPSDSTNDRIPCTRRKLRLHRSCSCTAVSRIAHPLVPLMEIALFWRDVVVMGDSREFSAHGELG